MKSVSLKSSFGTHIPQKEEQIFQMKNKQKDSP